MLSYCRRNRVFLSYAREIAPLAERVRIAAEDANFSVFLDVESMKSGGWRARINDEIDKCDLFLVLVTAEVFSDESFVPNELERIKRRWRSPRGRLIPIIVSDDVAIERLTSWDDWLGEVQVTVARGERVAAILAALEDARYTRPVCKAIQVIVASVAMVALLFLGVRTYLAQRNEIRLELPETVELRSLRTPPDCETAAGGHADWLERDAGLVLLSFTISHRAPGGSAVTVKSARAILTVDGEEKRFTWWRFVELRNSARREGAPTWLNDVANAEPLDIEAGKSFSKEVLLKPEYGTFGWQEFFTKYRAASYPEMHLRISTDVEFFGDLGVEDQTRSLQCRLEPDFSESDITGYVSECGRIPGYIQFDCRQ